LPEEEDAPLHIMECVRLYPAETPIQRPTAKELELYSQEKYRELEEAGEKAPEAGTGRWKVLGPTACDRLQVEGLI
jgi:hypothetical protein